jgi:hypothetical protein
LIERLRSELVLTPVGREDYDELRRAELQQQRASTWRFGGIHIAPEAYPASLWGGATHNLVVRRRGEQQIVGLTTSYNLSERDQHCYFAAACFREDPPSRLLVLLAIGASFDIFFETLPIGKIYAEVLEDNLPQFRSMTTSLFQCEGTLRDHRWANGRLQDVYILAITRARWSTFEIDGKSE